MNSVVGYGCPLCNEPPPHSHSLGVIVNSRLFCVVDGRPQANEYGKITEHSWSEPSRWLKRVHCVKCGLRRIRRRRK